MNTIIYVTESHVTGDEKEEISIPEERDIIEWINTTISPIRRKQESLDKKIEGCKEQVASLKEAHETSMQNVQKKLDAVTGQFSSMQTQFNELLGNLNSEFLAKCDGELRAFLTPYLNELGKFTAETKNVAESNQKLQEIIHSQMVISSALADYFCSKFKNELESRKQDLLLEGAKIEKLESILKQQPEQPVK